MNKWQELRIHWTWERLLIFQRFIYDALHRALALLHQKIQYENRQVKT